MAALTKTDEQDAERLIDAFKTTCCARWTREQIADDKLMRYAETYLMMARAKYRPAAPSDGFGNIQLSDDEFRDPSRLYLEAVKYAVTFCREEDGDRFYIGCSNFSTNRAFILLIEAARLLAGGNEGNSYALQMLRLASAEIKAAAKEAIALFVHRTGKPPKQPKQ
jgi:hypothetical protein